MDKVWVQRVSRVDAQELIKFNQENRNYHRPWVFPFLDMVGFDSWYARSLTAATVSFVAREITSREIVGVININDIVMGSLQGGYLGYYGSYMYSGRGLMTDALRLVVQYAFVELGLHRLEANIQPQNAASIAVVRRVGFVKEGFSPRYLFIDGAWRDHERWATVADRQG